MCKYDRGGRGGGEKKCWLLLLSVQRDTDTDIWQVYGGRICGVMRGESVKNTDALVHGSVLSDT